MIAGNAVIALPIILGKQLLLQSTKNNPGPGGIIPGNILKEGRTNNEKLLLCKNIYERKNLLY